MRKRINMRGLVIAAVVGGAVLAAAAMGCGTSKKRETVTFHPASSDQVLNNPYTGFAPDARGGPYKQPHRLVYFNITWRDLEPAKGEYAFESIEVHNQLAQWANQGQTFIFRLVADIPGATPHRDIPDWLYDEIGGDGLNYSTEYGKGFSPNYSNVRLISAHERLLKALGERYNKDERVAFVEIGSIGHWGEWHTKNEDGGFPDFPKREIADQYVEHYRQAFPNKPMLMRRPTTIAKESRLGLFNDMFGNVEHTQEEFLSWVNQGYTFWLTDEEIPEMPDFWKYAPSGGEFADSEQPDKYMLHDRLSTTLQQLKDSHTSWLGPSAPVNLTRGGPEQVAIDELLRTMGYRFAIVSETHPKLVRTGEPFTTELAWSNTGVAPFYFAWPIELSLADSFGNIVYRTRSTWDIRQLQPGSWHTTDQLTLPRELNPGDYTLCAAILSPYTGVPGIDLANQVRRADGRYPIGIVTVDR